MAMRPGSKMEESPEQRLLEEMDRANRNAIVLRMERQKRRHNFYEQRRLANARSSGQGEKECERRRKQIERGVLRVN